METKLLKLKVGTGNTVHLGTRNGIEYKALCGMKPNRGASIMRMTIPTWDHEVVTCKKCLADLAKQVK